MDSTVPNGARAIAVLCHPHPNYGGDRFNNVIESLFRTLPDAGIAAVRFDFRRPVPDGDLTMAIDDIAAAVDEARQLLPEAPIVLVGYSYGAAAVLAGSPTSSSFTAVVLVAPPLSMWPADGPELPTLVLVPAHDQFSPPSDVEPIVATWPDAEMEVVEMADHFLVGRSDVVASRAVTWLSSRLAIDAS